MTPKHELIKPLLLKEIEKIASNGSDKMPTELFLCKKYNVSRQTLRKATDSLINEGLLIRKQGSGCYITNKINQLLKKEGVLIIDTDSEYNNPLLIHELKKEFNNYGITLKVFTTEGSYLAEKKILQNIESENNLFIIIKPICSALPNPNQNIINKIATNISPVFYIYSSQYNSSLSQLCFQSDDFAGGYQAVEYLKSIDIKNIATVFQFDELYSLERISGILSAISDFELVYSDLNINWFTYTDLINLRKKTDTRFLSNILAKISGTCSGIICQNDEIAYWLQKELDKTSQEKPVILSFDNSYLSAISENKFLSIPFDYKKFASYIAQSINNFLNKRPATVYKQSWELLK